jgi:hypothetical protein
VLHEVRRIMTIVNFNPIKMTLHLIPIRHRLIS